MEWRLLALAEQLDDGLLRQVFTHSSWVAERGRSYERLEFLGDSVLSLSITTELYRQFPDHSEGNLARLRAYIVSRATCAKVATKLGLDGYLRTYGGRGGEHEQLADNQNVLADVTESLIGALYLSYGLDVVRPAVVEAFAEHISFADRSYIDHKTELQEQLAKVGRAVTYRLVDTQGPPHDRRFIVEAVVDGEPMASGSGASKKRAEQEAASLALEQLTGAEKRRKRRVRLRGRGGARKAAAVGGGETAQAGSADETAQAAGGSGAAALD
jgi:ribonuclease-3